MSTFDSEFQRFQGGIQHETADIYDVLDYLVGQTSPDAFAVLRVPFPATTEQVEAAFLAQDDLVRRRTKHWRRPNHNLRQIIKEARNVLVTPEKQVFYCEWFVGQKQAREREAQAARERQEWEHQQAREAQEQQAREYAQEQARQQQEAEEQRRATEQKEQKQKREEQARKWQWLRLILTNFIFWAVLFTAIAFTFPTIRLWVGVLAMICATVAWRQTPRVAFLSRRIVDTAFYGAAGLVFITVVHIPGFGARTTFTPRQSSYTSAPIHKSLTAVIVKTVSSTSGPSASTQRATAESQRQTAMITASQKAASAKEIIDDVQARLIVLSGRQEQGQLTEQQAIIAKTTIREKCQLALQQSDDAIKSDRSNKQAWIQSIAALYYMANYHEATQYLSQAKTLFPGNSDFVPLDALVKQGLQRHSSRRS